VSVTLSMSARKSSHRTIFLIVSNGSPLALIASSLRSTSKKPVCPMTRSLDPPMAHCGQRVRFIATWREEFFEVPASRVAARPGKAGDQPMRDRVSANAKGDRDRRGRSFGRPRRRIANRSDNGDATADEVGHERRQAVVFAVQPMILHRHVLALYVAGFGEAFTERACMARGAIERPTADKADHRHRLLRARRERPRSRAAEKRDEIATLHSITSSARALSVVGT